MTASRRALLATMAVLLAPATAAASPPPEEFPEAVSLLPTLCAMGLLALTGVAFGLLRARQRPGRVFVGTAIVGGAALGAAALFTDPVVDVEHWGAGLQIEALALVAASLGAWAWGRGPERAGWSWAGTLVGATAVLAAALWAGALARVAAAPYQRAMAFPEECGRSRSWDRPLVPAPPSRWLDHRVAVRWQRGEEAELVASAPNGEGDSVELILLHDGPVGATQVASRTLAIDGGWLGIAGDDDGRVYGAWTSRDRAGVTVVRIGRDLGIVAQRSFPAAPGDAQPMLDAGERACLSTSVWERGRVQWRALVLDVALRPERRGAAFVAALGGTRALGGAIALPLTLLLYAVLAIVALRERALARVPRWRGRLASGGTVLEVDDGTRLALDGPPRLLARLRGLEGLEVVTLIARPLTRPAGGPYRQSLATVRPRLVEAGDWPDVVARRAAQRGRVAVWVAACTAVLAVSALDLWIFR